MSMHDAFTRAYKDGQWHNGSGSGSSPANTRIYRRLLKWYLHEHRIGSVLDAGCGDWQFSRLIDWSGIAYLGLDVIPGITEANTLQYAGQGRGRAHVSFATADILTLARLPDADLILVKDLLQHWPDAAIGQLGRLLEGRRALLTYDVTAGPHADTAPGGYRPLDLRRPPYCWPVTELVRYGSVSHGGAVRRIKTVAELAP